ncbi:cytochrome b/b6 domain-containing protein [uncultured Celeribacter sp.]|uniref:cytochrome b/b6 domain-containing protein n=1 Tax=uncultured Celeribacter sp. TaxID=1303376 RepID=UPI002AA8A6F2|nr:cytochrome b/b6 domain-containing protein [uncultured Celeribacter sp.]
MTKRIVKVYPRFERLWHWTQALLIAVLMFTGLRVSGVHALIPFGPAVILHTLAALTLLVVWIFATFWLFTTGTWRQFLPKVEGMLATARYYAYGIFKGEEPPYQKQYWRKHNPLQAATYFGLKWFVFPVIWVTGIIYLTYNFWDSGADSTFVLQVVRNIHLLAAYVIFAFVIAHIYLLTTGHGFRDHVRPMVTGYEEIDLTPEQEAYFEANTPDRLKPLEPAE